MAYYYLPFTETIISSPTSEVPDIIACNDDDNYPNIDLNGFDFEVLSEIEIETELNLSGTNAFDRARYIPTIANNTVKILKKL